MPRLLRTALALAAQPLIAGLIAPGAFAAVGDLSNPSCIKYLAAEECGSATLGLDGAYSVAVSPDGRFAYVAAYVSNAIVVFDRDPQSGGLSAPRCVDDPATGVCAASAPGLDGVMSVALSADGRSLYAASYVDDAVITFDRDVSTGTLANARCVEDGAVGECGQAGDGLNGARSVAVSPDGRSVYAASFFDDAVARFDRDPATGTLTTQSCIKDSAPAECGQSAEGLEGPESVTISPDGASVYVASRVGAAVAGFDRAASGALTDPFCIRDDAPGDCAIGAEGLLGAHSVAVSPDGRSVYVVSDRDNAIVGFRRDPVTGGLSDPQCTQDPFLGECSSTAEGLDGAQSVAISPDGLSVYVAGFDSDAIAGFDRAADGSLSRPRCIANAEFSTADCSSTADGLEGVAAVTVSPDGRSLYAASDLDRAVTSFSRELPPPAAGGGPSVLPPGPVPAAKRCRTGKRLKRGKCVKRKKKPRK